MEAQVKECSSAGIESCLHRVASIYRPDNACSLATWMAPVRDVAHGLGKADALGEQLAALGYLCRPTVFTGRDHHGTSTITVALELSGWRTE